MYPEGYICQKAFSKHAPSGGVQITGMIFRHALVLKISDKDQGIKRYSGNEL